MICPLWTSWSVCDPKDVFLSPSLVAAKSLQVLFSERSRSGLSKEKVAEIQAQIEADRRKLEKSKDMAEEEKRKVEEDLEEKELELQKAGWAKENCFLLWNRECHQRLYSSWLPCLQDSHIAITINVLGVALSQWL